MISWQFRGVGLYVGGNQGVWSQHLAPSMQVLLLLTVPHQAIEPYLSQRCGLGVLWEELSEFRFDTLVAGSVWGQRSGSPDLQGLTRKFLKILELI